MIKIETNHGTITIELDAEKAPLTTANFKKYFENGFFNPLFSVWLVLLLYEPVQVLYRQGDYVQRPNLLK